MFIQIMKSYKQLSKGSENWFDEGIGCFEGKLKENKM